MSNLAGIPEVIRDFNLYLTGNRLAGLTGEVPLPDFEAITATISGNGILGEYEAAVPGHFPSMAPEIPFRCINEDYFKMIDPTQPIELTLRGSIQQTDPTTHGTGEVGMRVIMSGRPKTFAIGTVKQRNGMDSKITPELTRIIVELDGKERVALDKFNSVYRINGIDILAKTRQLT